MFHNDEKVIRTPQFVLNSWDILRIIIFFTQVMWAWVQIFGKIGWSVYHICTSRQIDATRAKVYLSDPGLIGLKGWRFEKVFQDTKDVKILNF